MIQPSAAVTLCAYNRWMNERIYDVCASLTDSERKLDRGAFFGSIHRTLDHIVYGDLAFLSRFTGDPSEPPELTEAQFEDFASLRQERDRIDGRLETWAGGLTQSWLEAPFTYTSKVDGLTRRTPAWLLVVHLFNHQTHHRGQVTTLLTQLGLEFGSTDLPFTPGLTEIVDPGNEPASRPSGRSGSGRPR